MDPGTVLWNLKKKIKLFVLLQSLRYCKHYDKHNMVFYRRVFFVLLIVELTII
jgi:hypothetical protein